MERDELLRTLRRRDVPARVVDAVASVPRDCFVPPAVRDRAWEDGALPIGCGQTITQPFLVAHMAGLLAVGPDDRVLDVGTGSGYHAAVLARLAAHVFSLERHPALSAAAAESLAAAGIDNVTLLVGDGADGLPEEAPFQAINVAAAVDGPLPGALLDQLDEGGRLVAPQRGRDERLVLVCRRRGRLLVSDHGAVRFVPLVRQ